MMTKDAVLQFEPAAQLWPTSSSIETVKAMAQISSAISLKRIADFLNGKADGSTMDLVQYVTDAVHKERRS